MSALDDTNQLIEAANNKDYVLVFIKVIDIKLKIDPPPPNSIELLELLTARKFLLRIHPYYLKYNNFKNKQRQGAVHEITEKHIQNALNNLTELTQLTSSTIEKFSRFDRFKRKRGKIGIEDAFQDPISESEENSSSDEAEEVKNGMNSFFQILNAFGNKIFETTNSIDEENIESNSVEHKENEHTITTISKPIKTTSKRPVTKDTVGSSTTPRVKQTKTTHITNNPTKNSTCIRKTTIPVRSIGNTVTTMKLKTNTSTKTNLTRDTKTVNKNVTKSTRASN